MPLRYFDKPAGGNGAREKGTKGEEQMSRRVIDFEGPHSPQLVIVYRCTNPCRRAAMAACVRCATPNRTKITPTWHLTVASAILSASAISRLLFPWAINEST